MNKTNELQKIRKKYKIGQFGEIRWFVMTFNSFFTKLKLIIIHY